MAKDTKIVHVQVVDGDQDTINNLGSLLQDFVKKNDLPYEFLITNDNIQLYDVKYLLDELYRLYKNYKKIKEASEKNAKT